MNDILRDIAKLSIKEQGKVFYSLKGKLYPDSARPLESTYEDIRESRFKDGLGCVHCGSKSVKRNGKYRSRERYLCHDCGKSFNDTTGSPIARTRYPQLWMKYLKMMVEGCTLPQISEELGIHLSTCFYWRHKVLFALRSNGFNQLSGIIESDETFFLESEKGKKNINHRLPRERGGVASKRGISNEQICVIVAKDRQGNLVSRYAGRGRITHGEIEQSLGEYIDSSALLCTDSAKNYIAFAKSRGIQHEVVNMNKKQYVNKGLYHVQHVNNYHKRLKDWMERFQGVATKYLDNYLYWHRFLELVKNLHKKDATITLLLHACNIPTHLTIEKMKKDCF
ncbi:IS1595 family transposase [Bacillus cereus]|uniref:IS1595 family transposase n=1 Tax=Bacillus cereus TaxID=1396 RepID=UPI0025A08EEB|nr:IS1595 family transposase [Bacillus cereus]MDM5239175.1 IS1595 family transposase [Bacillus cereus]